MIENERLVRARLGILALAAELHNVAKACKLAGLSRSQFYAMKKAYETYGRNGLAPRIRRKPVMPNRTPAYLEERILSHTRRNPLVSYVRLAREIQPDEGPVTPAMVRYVWQRHGLSKRSARVEWTRGHTAEREAADNPYEIRSIQQTIP